jgi:hypothetical protein
MTTDSSDHSTATDESSAPDDTDGDSPLPALPSTGAEPHVPDPPPARQYIEIRPTTAPLNPRRVRETLERLASLLRSETASGLRTRLRGTTRRPAVEWVLVGDGREDTSVRWLVGFSLGDGEAEPAAVTAAIQHGAPARTHVSGDPDRVERAARLDDLFNAGERLLRRLLPAQYELTRVQWHPRYIEEHLPAPAVDTPAQSHPSITVEHPYVAGVEFRGDATFGRDWLLPLRAFGPRPSRRVRDYPTGHRSRHTPADDRSSVHRIETDPAQPARSGPSPATHEPETADCPLVDVIEQLRDARLPTIYQAVCRPIEWADNRADYELDLADRSVTVADKLINVVWPDLTDDTTLPRAYAERLAGLEDRASSGFVVAARAAVLTRTAPDLANRVATRLAPTLAAAAEPRAHHRITGHVRTDDEFHTGRTPPGRALFETIVTRAVPAPSYEDRSWRRLGTRTPSPGIVVTAAELPGLCLVDGAQLTPHAERALATRPAERTGLVLPPPAQLRPYQGPGMELCLPLTHDRRPTGRPVVLPPAFQDRHLVVAGASGAGKSVLMNRMLRSNVETVGGLHVVLDYKGTDTTRALLQTHYAAHDSLDDVVYFDLTETLPAFSLFDIRPLLAAGVTREEARSRVAANYVEMLRAIMTPEKFDSALYAADIITNHIRALFDPVHGRDVFSHQALADALRGTREGSPPTVSDDELAASFTELLAEPQRTFQAKLTAAISRVSVINADQRLRPLFTHTPDRAADPDATPAFSVHDWLDEDVTVVFDFAGMDREMKNGLTLGILSALWAALTCRAEADHAGVARSVDRRLVNLVLEEAGDVADTALVDTLLREGRSFGLSVALGVQFPEQLRSSDPDRNTYRELLNEVATFVVGNVAIDDDLAQSLATAAMPPAMVATRLRALARGEWLVRPAAAFGDDPPRPFLATSLDPPEGHPAGDEPLSDADARRYERAVVRAQAESARHYGYQLVTPADRDGPGTDTGADPTADADVNTNGDAPVADAASDTDAAADTPTEIPSTVAVDSLLPHTERLPAPIVYDERSHTLRCATCDTRYDPTLDGLRDGVDCCQSLAAIDRDDIPPCQSSLKLSPEEVAASPFSLAQLLYTQAVFNAQQGVFDPLEYDITTDSMRRLQEYVGIDRDAVQTLLDEGVLRKDTTYPHLLYSVAPQARSVIGEAYREGIDYGDGRGDLEESSEHVILVEVAARWAAHTFVDDPERPGTTVKRYHELDDGRRLDCAVLDDDGDVRVAIEAERVNNDTREAVPADYDKLAACAPDEAVWVVTGRQDAHDVLQALNDPLDGEPRVTTTYSETSPPQRWRIDRPGATAFHTFAYLRRALDESDE